MSTIITFAPEMSTAGHFALVKPVPRRARAPVNRPASPPTTPKQITARCGSASAPDPLGKHTTRPARTSVTKLTIVRVAQPKTDAEANEESSKKLRRRQTVGRASGFRPPTPTRLSFASASFSTPTSPTDTVHAPRKPASPARLSFAAASFAPPDNSRSSSFARTHAKAVSSPYPMLVPFERLAPAQIPDLAKSSSRPTTNVLPTGRAPSTLIMPLTEDIYLPFIDRPTEVLELLTRSDNKKLVVLFARMLPASGEAYYPRSSAELAATVGTWSFEDFTTWLTQVSREEIEDEEWVRALRLFVLPKGEVLWERLKCMLGVPPELDVDPEFEDEAKRFSAKKSGLRIAPIYPAPFSSGKRLDDISEIVEEGTTDVTNEVVGLRISTSVSFPSSSTSVKTARTVPSSPRVRTPAQGYAPLVSSPLVPKPTSQPRPRSAPPQKSVSASLLPGLLSKFRSKDLACPMFPTSFDKLGIQPTLLHIV